MDFILPDRTEQTVRRGMENGTFFSVGRRAVYEFGKDFVGEGEYPTVTRITVNEDEQSISIEGKNYNRVQWISNGKIIAEGEKSISSPRRRTSAAMSALSCSEKAAYV